jgi:hypothetical protein
VLALLVVLLVAALTDVAAVAWHHARERGLAGRAAALAMLLEAAGWLPVAWAIETGDMRVAGASIVGSGIGCWLAVRRLRTRTLDVDCDL